MPKIAPEDFVKTYYFHPDVSPGFFKLNFGTVRVINDEYNKQFNMLSNAKTLHCRYNVTPSKNKGSLAHMFQ